MLRRLQLSVFCHFNSVGLHRQQYSLCVSPLVRTASLRQGMQNQSAVKERCNLAWASYPWCQDHDLLHVLTWVAPVDVKADCHSNLVQSGVTNAERLLEKYHNEWNESVDPIYNDDFTYWPLVKGSEAAATVAAHSCMWTSGTLSGRSHRFAICLLNL